MKLKKNEIMGLVVMIVTGLAGVAGQYYLQEQVKDEVREEVSKQLAEFPKEESR